MRHRFPGLRALDDDHRRQHEAATDDLDGGHPVSEQENRQPDCDHRLQVLNSAARAAPTRGRPARNSEIASIVGTIARPTTTAQLATVGGRLSWWLTAASNANASPAPLMITALAGSAGTESITRSPTRMYAV